MHIQRGKAMRRYFRFLPALFVTGCAAAVGQTAPAAAHVPYTAKYKITSLNRLPDGSSSNSISTMVEALDSKGDRAIIYTFGSSSSNPQPRTDVQLRDLTNLTMSYWSIPGTTLQIVHMPDLDQPDNDCAKKMKAIDELHPVGAESLRGEPLAIKDLGTQVIHGIQARGGEVTFTSTFVRPGQSGPAIRTNQVWTAADPNLGKLVVRSISKTSQGESTTRELVEFIQGEPDPKFFEVPQGREVKKREGQAFTCDIKPKPVPTPAAK
jgi:hypothetical protein